MAEKKKGKRRKEEYIAPGEEKSIKPSKDEYAVAKWMRKHVPIKKTKFLNHNVQYFTASKAVDALLESDWSKSDEPFFKTREAIVDYLHGMLVHKFFHRARKVPVSEHELKPKKKEKKSTESAGDKKTDGNEKEIEKQRKEKGTDAESSVAEVKKEEASLSDKEKRKRKIRLDMHNDQRFVDGLDAYVWIYDPIPFYYWIFGALVVLAAIGVCLFPLWPPQVRLGVYYLSVAAAVFLVFIILLAIFRLIVFCLVWLVTFGKHHIWILPNLTEDVGFFASFWPLYAYEYKGDNPEDTPEKKKKKDKDSDAEEDNEKKVESEEIHVSPVSSDTKETKDTSSTRNVSEDDRQNEGTANLENGSQIDEAVGASESESESSQRSSTGKDFEIVDQVDLES
ncbi:hypothetical protein ILUMI_09069 [Ignelater luminosus]|uniref:Translocation protein SEC62 n=1 Tax=Ignelater luminosus TaxID=2038154 RepID=A0A8K0GA09_IGNLU|nr:hypothetical protein ILUMI_09069 [Ignelater luminosus]